MVFLFVGSLHMILGHSIYFRMHYCNAFCPAIDSDLTSWLTFDPQVHPASAEILNYAFSFVLFIFLLIKNNILCRFLFCLLSILYSLIKDPTTERIPKFLNMILFIYSINSRFVFNQTSHSSIE